MKHTKRILLGALFSGVLAAGGLAAPASAGSPTRKPALATAHLHIEKMACIACAARVTKVLTQIPGVRDARVGLKEKGAVVEYDPAKVSPKQLADAIDQAGYKATVEPKTGSAPLPQPRS